MIRDIIVNLAVSGARDPAVDYAVSIASAFDAHLCGVAFAYDPIIPPSAIDGASAEVIDAESSRGRNEALAATQRLANAASAAGRPAQVEVMEASLGGAGTLFAQLSRRFDLVIAGQPDAGGASPDDLVIETTLLESGRPVLVVPFVQTAPLRLDQVLVCWDGRRTAARAIADAMPFLRRAAAVDLVTVGDGRAQVGVAEGIDMAGHLARHGVSVSQRDIVPGNMDVANVLLSHAADIGADFVVMGGYGRSRLREFLLGGATRGILRAMTAPTFMSH